MSLSDHTQPDHTQPDHTHRAAQDPLAGDRMASTPVPPAVGFTQPASTQVEYPYAGHLYGGHAPVGSALPVEIVPRGILFSLAAIPLGMAASVLIWKLGFVASITSFLIAGAAGWLYVKGARAVPRRGWLPLLAVILVGVAASFFAIVGADLVEYYNTPDGQSLGYPSVVDFVSANLFNRDVLASYGSDLAMFLLFAALGVFGTVRRLLGVRKAV